MTDYWMCEGSVRGACGTRHRSEETAAAHCCKDQRDVVAGHGRTAYSDRRPVRYPASADEWLTIAQVAERLGLSVRTIEDYRLDGRMPPPHVVGRTPVWTRQQVDEWQERRPGRGRWGKRGVV